MSGPMRFPKDPLKGTEGRFSDEHGNNPFADKDAPPVQHMPADNLYSTSTSDNEPENDPEFEQILQASRSVLPIAITGSVVSIIAAVVLIWQLLALFICIAGLVISISAVVLGRNDLQSMRSGAMDNSAANIAILGVAIGSVGAGIATAAITISIVLRGTVL